MKKLKLGIAGLGKLGTYHIQNILQIPAANLAAVHDIDARRGQEIADEYGIDFFPDFPALLDAVDAVSIAVPTVSHHDLAMQALAAGKPVFVEKPIAANLAQAGELVDYSVRQGVPLQIGHVERFNPAFTGLELSGLSPMFIEAHRLASFDPRGSDVAVVLDLMIHDIDLVNAIVRSPIQRIDASGVSVISDKEDIANARLQFENGCVANLTASRISLKKMRKMRLFQPDSYVSIDFLLGTSEIYSLQDLPSGDQGRSLIPWGVIEKDGLRKQIKYDKIQSNEQNALLAELNAFVQAVRTGGPVTVTGEQGLKALDVAIRILDQIQGKSGAGAQS